MSHLKIQEQVYNSMMLVLGQRPFNEVHLICRGLQSGVLRADDGLLLIRAELVQPAVDFMHTKCLHCEVHEILDHILAASRVSVAEESSNQSRKKSVAPKT